MKNTINTPVIDIINGELLGHGWLGYPTKNKKVNILDLVANIEKQRAHIFSVESFIWDMLRSRANAESWCR